MLFTGRLHPMLVHLPIGMFVLATFLYLLKNKFDKSNIDPILHFIFALSTLTALISAIAGLFLGLENGYEADALKWHKNAAVAFSLTQYMIYALYSKNTQLKNLLIASAAILLLIAGHFGANITHGKNFVFPEKSTLEHNPKVDINTNSLFEFAIQPIFNRKCISCHNNEKSKGELNLTDTLSIKKGGKHGLVFIAGNAMDSKIIKSLLLPIKDELHMPPDGKQQLTQVEKNIIRQWILSGASFNKKYEQYSVKDSFRILAASMGVEQKPEKKYAFESASKETIKAINSPYLSLNPIDINSPALEANFFVSTAFSLNNLKSLLKVKKQLVSLNLSSMPLDNEAIKILPQFSALEKLMVNGCKITDVQFDELTKLPLLEELSAYNNPLTMKIGKSIKQFKAIKSLYLYNTNVPYADILSFQKLYPKIKFYSLAPITELTELASPNIENENTVLKKDETVKLKQVINGAKIKYTIGDAIPDSLHGEFYTSPITIKGSTQINTISVKEGWRNSPVATYHFFEKGLKPDECKLLTQANVQYLGLGKETFINSEKGPITNLKDQNWIAFKEVPFAAIFSFKASTPIRKIAFCYGLQVPAYVFPPTSIKVYGSNSTANFKLLQEVKLPPFDKNNKDQVKTEVILLSLANAAYKNYKIEAQNLPKIPKWHPGKGEPGWLFIDEIFFYQ